ncbi:MAG: alkaline phosphatase family protein [Deltaproteobacteria bacterium]|nr:alkaline phosphatase family protein [Deltaproteobacteria bacterium]
MMDLRPETPGTPRKDLAGARSELQRLGYLNDGFGRFLLQDALRPNQPLRTLLWVPAKIAVAGGVLVSLVLSFALAAVNGNLASSPFDLLPLFLHLFPLAAAALGTTFLLLSGLLVVVLRFYHARRIEVVAFAVALVAGLAAAALVLWRFVDLLPRSSPWLLAPLLIAAPVVAYLLIKVVESGLLGLAIRLTEQTPVQRIFSRRWIAAAVLVAMALITLPAVLAVSQDPVSVATNLPSKAGDRVLLVGVDGVLASELEYLLSRGELPSLQALLDTGGRVGRYVRPVVAPATFWTSIATGLAAPDHGVVALDSFLPVGLSTPLAINGPLRAYWRSVAVPLGLAEYRPVLAARRRAYTFWELASRGGQPVAAINWWSTFPADPLPGLVVAHGAYQLLLEGTEGAVEAESRPELTHRVAELARATSRERPADSLWAYPPEGALDLVSRALLPDDFASSVFDLARDFEPWAVALYLPALDLAADGWQGGGVAFADLVRSELAKVEALVASTTEDFDTIAVVFDPGRRPGFEGRVLLWRRSGCTGAQGPAQESVQETGRESALTGSIALPTLTPQELGAGLLRALGLPQSRELPLPPALCQWPSAADVVDGFGSRQPTRDIGRDGGEYLENLRSLGYL